MREKLENELKLKIDWEKTFSGLLHVTHYYAVEIGGIEYCVSYAKHKDGTLTYCLSDSINPNDLIYYGFSEKDLFEAIRKLCKE